MSPRRVASLAAIAAVLVLVVPAASPAGAQEEAPDVEFTARIDGRDVTDAGSNDAVPLDPTGITTIDLAITNNGSDPVTVRRVRLFGEAFGLTLVAYDVTIELPVGAGASETVEVPVEFIDLDRQATGLLPGGLTLYDPERRPLATERFVIDVQGSWTSVLGLFGIFVAVATALGIAGIVLGVSRRTLGPNRVRRAVRFGFVGLGVGLTFVISLAVFRIVAPTGAVWILLLLVPAVAGALLGYLSPGPLAIEESDDIDDAVRDPESADA